MSAGGALAAHLATGATTLCRAWAVARPDGVVLGFTDHDRPLSFDGIDFRADAGLTARALSQSSGLSVDNTEAVGALADAAITGADIAAGRYDGAEVRIWLVNWAAPEERALEFRGSLGEIERAGDVFRAELRGLAEALNRPQGRVYQTPCRAVLGDAACGVDLDAPGFSTFLAAETVEGARVFRFAEFGGFAERWFERGRLTVETGAAGGLSAMIKNDRIEDGARLIELWQALRAEVAPGDRLRLEAGCDKRAGTCKVKFNNFSNFRGFPHIPGEDWLMSYPAEGGVHDGGSLTR